ncbi:hypothetical protein [Helicobacter suis]|uniref:hypothetical protein n=1 Tax=Helicobacter suis TaxID=104628 RepID=UPI0013D25350|nr:hypothetical protein [Helicobacter suis]
MRLVEFNAVGAVSLLSRYGCIKLRLNVNHSALLVPNALSESYVFEREDNQVINFSVCEGEGVLNPLDYPKAYHFLELDVYALETYLIKGIMPTSLRQRELISAYNEIYNINIKKHNYYLAPPYFKQVEEKLLC